MSPLSRRGFLQSSLAFGLSAPACVASAPANSSSRLRSPVAISSANGLQAVALAVQRMNEGWRPVDAAVAGVELVENDPNDDSVGLGGLPNEDGTVELEFGGQRGQWQ